jgi:GABA(A) receptor-associated protein
MLNKSLIIHKRYPNHVPVILESKSNEIILTKKKYLVPSEYTVGMFMNQLREKIKIKPSIAIFIFINNQLPTMTDTFGELNINYKDSETNMLHAYITQEHTFG